MKFQNCLHISAQTTAQLEHVVTGLQDRRGPERTFSAPTLGKLEINDLFSSTFY